MRHWRACPNGTLPGKPDAPLLVRNVHGRRIGDTQQSFTVKEEVGKISISSGAPKTKRRRGLFLIQLLVVAGLLTAVWLSFGQNVLAPQKSMLAPERLGDLHLVSTVEGPEAMKGVNRLHGTDIGLTNAYIVEYATGTERATVWVGNAESRDAAAGLFRKMIEGIEKGGSGFNNLQRLTITGLEVFRVDGPGGEHFFYISREKQESVVWLILNAADTLPIMEQAVKTF